MSMKTCIRKLREVTEKAGLKLDERNIKMFAAQLEAKRADLLTQKEFAKAAAELLSEQFERVGEARKARLAQDTAIVKGASHAIRSGELGGKDIVENLANWIHGGAIKPSEGGRVDPRLVAGQISTDLRRKWNVASKPYADIISRRLLIDEVFQELAAIRDGLPAGRSGSKEAVGIAKAMRATSNEVFDVKAAYNPDMMKNENFLANVFWEREKVSATPKKEMIALWERYDPFPELNAAERSDTLSRLYDRISAGVFGTIQDTADGGKYITGDSTRADIARRMARSKKLTTSDWRLEAEAFKRFGPDTIGDLMGRVINKTGKDVAILSKFGSNPREGFNRVFNDVRARVSEPERIRLDSERKTLESVFSQVMGEGDGPAITPMAKWTQGLLTAQYASKTSLSYFSMLPDLALSAGQLRALNGQSLAGNAAEVFGAYVHAMGSSEFRTQHLEDMVIYASSAHANIIGASVAPGKNSGALGRLNWIAEKVGVLGAHERHVQALKSAISSLIGKWLSRISDIPFSELEARAKNGLLAYGIGEHEWDAIRATHETQGEHGKFITVQGIENMPDEAVVDYMHRSGKLEGGGEEAPSKEAIFLARKNLSLALGLLVNDHADYGTSTAGSRQKALMFGGRNINTTRGQLERMFFQFKGAAATTFDAYRRLYYAEGKASGGDWAGVAAAMTAAMFWYTIKEYAQGALQGKTPEGFVDNPKFALKVFIGSGVGGLAGDSLLGVLDAHGTKDAGEKLLASATGPVATTAGQAAGVGTEYIKRAYRTYEGENTRFGPVNKDAFNLVINNIPGLNIMNAKNVMNYFFLNEAREFMDQGYLRALEKNVNDTPGLFSDRQEYFLGGPSFSQ